MRTFIQGARVVLSSGPRLQRRGRHLASAPRAASAGDEASSTGAQATEPLSTPTPAETVDIKDEAAPGPETPGEKLAQWLQSPFDLAAFGPRLSVGALLSAPERVSRMGDDLQELSNILNSPAPPEDKLKLIATELESITTSYLEKGAFVEADVIRQVKALLPAEVASSIEMPTTPSSQKPDNYEAAAAVAPLSTSTSPTVTKLPDDVDMA